MLRIVVTGAAGRIGSAIVALARARGHEVVPVDVREAPESRVLDIRDVDGLARACEGADAVVHAAGLHAPHVGRVSDDAFRAINVQGTSAVLRAIALAGVPRLVLTSSTALLGGGAPEGAAARWIDARTPPSPRTIYHTTKLRAENHVREAASGGLEAAIVRLGRCFPEPLAEMAVHRLARGLDPRDAASAHLSALHRASTDARALIACATTPFEPDDCATLGSAADRVIARRCPGLVEAFVARGWVLPRRIDRVYDNSAAREEWARTPRYDVWSLLEEESS